MELLRDHLVGLEVCKSRAFNENMANTRSQNLLQSTTLPALMQQDRLTDTVPIVVVPLAYSCALLLLAELQTPETEDTILTRTLWRPVVVAEDALW